MDLAEFVIIGENIHCSRRFKLEGIRIAHHDDGSKAVKYRGPDGARREMPIPEKWQQDQQYQNGMVSHVQVAVRHGLEGSGEEQRIGKDYVHAIAREQIKRGAHYLDVNVDEIDPRPQVRNAAMEWLVQAVQEIAEIPLSIDSSDSETIRVGLKALDRDKAGRPMLNSAALERPETFDFLREYECACIVMASHPAEGMPEGTEKRVRNIEMALAQLQERDVPLSDIYVDALIYPASAKQEEAACYLAAIRQIRQKYGPEIHIAGGISNVSFGLPMRRLLNAVFIHLHVEHGGDSGIIDPLTCHPDDLAQLDPDSEAFRLAVRGFRNEDPYFTELIMAYREGEIVDPFAKKKKKKKKQP